MEEDNLNSPAAPAVAGDAAAASVVLPSLSSLSIYDKPLSRSKSTSPPDVSTRRNHTAILHFGVPLDDVHAHVQANGGSLQMEFIFVGDDYTQGKGSCRVLCPTFEAKTALLDSPVQLSPNMVKHSSGEECPLPSPCGL
ncbi:hypothetical protein CASFOL_027893 [Castilleja foliolosa]|uniref:RRM domain-containing protein n=1 Tax=Castilleja foliolosa TaxID=1961234 RepID=A0ABD3CJR2_9LAMI